MSRLILAVAILVLSLSPLSAEISHEVAGAPPRRFGRNEEPADLEPILKKVAEYCQRLERVSLHFVCHEKINERLYYSWRAPSAFAGKSSLFQDNAYVYDYQLIRKDGDIQERRILLEEDGESRHEENAELRTERFRHKYVIFGPIGLLSEAQQQNLNYTVKKEEKLKGDSCLVIEAVPKAGVRVERLFGRIWVRKNDFSIMKIEWNQESMGNIERVEEEAKRIGAKPSLTFVSEYAYEKNGIRFPSKYFVREEYVHPAAGRVKISETTVIYRDYKFFTVETEVKIK